MIHFINDILELKASKKIHAVEFLKTVQDPEIAAQKQSLIDVLCTDETGRQYIIEMQVVSRAGFEKRAQYYAAKAYSRQMMKGEQYHQLKEIIFIAITNFVMFPAKKAYKSDHVILDKATFEHNLKDFSFTFLELPKFEKTLDELKTLVDKWAYFFKHAKETEEKDLARIVGKDIVIKEAYEALNRFSMSEAELNSYEQAKKRELDDKAILEFAEQTGIEKGIEIGEANKAKAVEETAKRVEEATKLKMAKAMLSKKITLQAIADCTGLSLKMIQSLQKATKK